MTAKFNSDKIHVFRVIMKIQHGETNNTEQLFLKLEWALSQ